MSFKLVVICSLITIFFSCQSKGDKEVNNLRTEYKNVVFQRCVFLGFNKSNEIRDLMKMDRSTHQDFAFGIEEYRFIDSLVQPIVLKAKIDSVHFYQKYLEGMNDVEQRELNGIPIFKFCLDFYTSNQLEKISRKRVISMKNIKSQ